MKIRRRIRTLRHLISRCRDTIWFVRKLGYPWRKAWARAGEWS